MAQPYNRDLGGKLVCRVARTATTFSVSLQSIRCDKLLAVVKRLCPFWARLWLDNACVLKAPWIEILGAFSLEPPVPYGGVPCVRSVPICRVVSVAVHDLEAACAGRYVMSAPLPNEIVILDGRLSAWPLECSVVRMAGIGGV